MDDVEMAHDEVFGGPMAESVPTSNSSFAHRRNRADSTASFTYYQDEEEELEQVLPSSSEDDSAILDDDEDLHYEEDSSVDLESGELAALRRSSSHSRASVHDRLLLRNDSTRTEGSFFERGHRTSQKIYVVTEDLTIVVAGFRTNHLRHALYLAICVLSLGTGFLLLRWLPRWRVRIIGTPSPLKSCSWVAIEVSEYFGLIPLLKSMQNRVLYPEYYAPLSQITRFCYY